MNILNSKIIAQDPSASYQSARIPWGLTWSLTYMPYVVETVAERHLESLDLLAHLMDSVNLNPARLAENAQRSQRSLREITSGRAKLSPDASFQFVLVDLNSKQAIGASSIVYDAGDPKDAPYWVYELDDGDLQLKRRPNAGPTTFGGIIVHDVFRGNPVFPFGKFMSWVRVAFVLEHPDVFTHTVYAEMLPIKSGGRGKPRQNAFWDVYGKPIAYTDSSGEQSEMITAATYDEVTKALHKPEVARRLPEMVPDRLRIADMEESVRETLFQIHPGAEPAAKNLAHVGFLNRGRFYPLDLGVILECRPKGLLFGGKQFQAMPTAMPNSHAFGKVGLVMARRSDHRAPSIRYILSPMNLNGSSLELPGTAYEKLELTRGLKRKEVSVTPIPSTLARKFYKSRST